MDESAFDFTAWAEDEPSGPEENEQCMEMWTNGLWNDNKCEKVFLFITYYLLINSSHYRLFVPNLPSIRSVWFQKSNENTVLIVTFK